MRAPTRCSLARRDDDASPTAGFYKIRRAPSIEELIAENEAKLLDAAQSAGGDDGAAAIKQQSARRVSQGQAMKTDRYLASTPQVHPVEVETDPDARSVHVADIEE